jgi:hypothetical protein
MASKAYQKASPAISLFFVVLIFSATTQAKIIYVDDDAAGADDGSSWPDAYNYLQDALAVAANGDEIRVAEGIYKPDRNSAYPDGSGDRAATFQLINGVTVKGGYAGFGEPNPDAHDIDSYETILSSDLNGDDLHVANPEDLLKEPTRVENSYHVVTSSDTNETAVLDGFTITAGNDNRYIHPRPSRPKLKIPIGYGAGMYNQGGSPTVTNCTFRENSTNNKGGGMFNSSHSRPALTNCSFSRNAAGIDGGGMYNSSHSSPVLTNCSFSGNAASTDGGGMYNSRVNSTMFNCNFNSNSAGDDGGGMYNKENNNLKLTSCSFSGNKAFGSPSYGGGICNKYYSNLTLANCTFGENVAGGGGGIYNGRETSLLMSNCTFSNNSAEDGGGIYNHLNNPTVTNCMFIGNSAEWGGGIFCWFESNVRLINCTFVGNSGANGNALACDSYGQKYPSIFQITNCILWDGDDGILNKDSSTISIMYSNIQNGWPGEGNINADPCFIDPGYRDLNGVWIDGDYHLLEDSPCVNAGDKLSLPPDWADLDVDGDMAEPIPWDLDGTPRVVDCRIDMGAYEYGQFIPTEVRIIPRTINLASKGKWITCFIWLPEEFNVSDIDPNSVLLECEIEVESLQVDEQEQIAVARFNREHVHTILKNGKYELTISVNLTDGTVFEGTDTIKVIDKAGGKPLK